MIKKNFSFEDLTGYGRHIAKCCRKAARACVFLCIFACCYAAEERNNDTSLNIKDEDWTDFHTIPVFSNAYTTGTGLSLNADNGTHNWTGTDGCYSIYFNVHRHGYLQLALVGCAGSSMGNILNVKVYVNDLLAHADGKTYDHDYLYKKTNPTDTIILDRLLLPEVAPGHAGNMVRIDLQAKGTRNGSYYFRFPSLRVRGEATHSADGADGADGAGLNFVPLSNQHFGRRGPSVHIRPDKPAGDMEYFYSEIYVPAGQDVLGSYFMCNGFGEGYAGIQVNSATERRVLFSVWSAYSTDNPALMGKYAPRLVRVNNQPAYRPTITYTKFGGEGSGGQSYMKYVWQAGVTYKMLTRVRPHPQPDKFPNSSLYKTWFHNGTEWIFIAEWRRIELDPEDNNGVAPTVRWYTGAHHFLENFSVSTGHITRYGTWDNQWFIDKNGRFFEPSEYTFTCDATAAAGHRVDYAGGVLPPNHPHTGAIFLKMAGYFTDNVSAHTRFTKPAKNIRPNIDFAALNAMGTDDPEADSVLDPGEKYEEE